MLLPAWLIEISYMPPVKWSWQLVLIILYLGLGTSVLAFLCWNAAIARLGAGRTALFGNLIPVFSSLQAVWLLNEQLTLIHLFSGLAVIAGVLIANLQKKKDKSLYCPGCSQQPLVFFVTSGCHPILRYRAGHHSPNNLKNPIQP